MLEYERKIIELEWKMIKLQKKCNASQPRIIILNFVGIKSEMFSETWAAFRT